MVPTRTAVLPLAGVAYTALLVVAAAAFPAPPGGDASPAADPAWLAAHSGAVTAQAYVRALAGLAFVVLAVAVARACRRAVGDPGSAAPALAGVGGVCCGLLLVLAQAPVLAAARLTEDGAPAATVRALAPLSESLLDLSSLPAVLLFGGAGVVALRTGLLPRWLGVLSLVGVPVALADAASYDGGPLAAVGLAGLVWFLGWSLLVGVRLALVPAADRPAAVPSAA